MRSDRLCGRRVSSRCVAGPPAAAAGAAGRHRTPAARPPSCRPGYTGRPRSGPARGPPAARTPARRCGRSPPNTPRTACRRSRRTAAPRQSAPGDADRRTDGQWLQRAYRHTAGEGDKNRDVRTGKDRTGTDRNRERDTEGVESTWDSSARFHTELVKRNNCGKIKTILHIVAHIVHFRR